MFEGNNDKQLIYCIECDETGGLIKDTEEVQLCQERILSAEVTYAFTTSYFKLVIANVNDQNIPKIQNLVQIFESEEVFTLKDPISLKKIKTSVVGVDCKHIQPFDLESYLNSQRYQALEWKCPICRKAAYFNDLRHVQYIQSFIDSNPKFDYSLRVHAQNGTIEYEKQDSEVKIVTTSTKVEGIDTMLTRIIKGFKEDKSYLKTKLNSQEVEYLFSHVSAMDIDLFSTLLNKVYEESISYLPLDNCKSDSDNLLEYCKGIYKHYKIVLIPLLFWPTISERNLVKLFQKLTTLRRHFISLLSAGAYFLFKYLHKKEVAIEFIYGKIYGYYIKSLPMIDQSSEFTRFVEKSITKFPHLHLPKETIDSGRELKKYYKNMTCFYVGLFSWFNVYFVAQSFKQIFAPPKKIETLDEKACINLFVQEVLLRVLKGLTFSLGDVIKFYELWDVHRVVLKMNKGYNYGHLTEQIGQFKQVLKLRQTKALDKGLQI